MNPTPQRHTQAGCQQSVGKQRVYLAWNIPGEITVGRELELAGLLGPVIHNLNVSRLHKHRHAKNTE